MQWLPLLQIQRDLLDVPRGAARFQQYLATMLDSNGELRLPLPAFNPMSKGHVADLLTQLLAIDAEAIGQAAVVEAAERLPGVAWSNSTQVALVVADDARGGWTNRYLFETKHLFESRYEQSHGFITALLWSSEPAMELTIRQKVLAAVYRNAWIGKHGPAKTLEEMVLQEGMAGRFAGLRMDVLPIELETLIGGHLKTTHYPTIVACLYGDDAAESCGYDPLGLPVQAGLRYGLSLAYALPDVVTQLD